MGRGSISLLSALLIEIASQSPTYIGIVLSPPASRTTVGAAPISLTDMNTPCTLQL